MKRALFAAMALSIVTPAEPAVAKNYVVLTDDTGTFAKENGTPTSFRAKLLSLYADTGYEMPEVFSVWMTFPMTGNDFVTFIDPRRNEVEGIGLPIFGSSSSTLRALLYHNNVTELAHRAEVERSPLEGFAEYLFLLEFSHLWGPQAQLPAPGPGALIGFDYHWSFFLNGTSPAGGNIWTDNGDGTFTVVPGAPSAVKFSPLDLYLMGLGTAFEVPPFFVLENTVVPATPTDPLWGGTFAARSFPWFDTVNPPMKVTATKRTATIDDIVTANGPRVPAAMTQTSWKVAFVLMTAASDTPEDVAAAEAVFDPIAEGLPSVFHAATSQRGSLEVVTTEPEVGGAGAGGNANPTTATTGSGGAAGGASAGGASAGNGGAMPADRAEGPDGCACRASSAVEGQAGWFALFALAAIAQRRRRV